MEIGIYIHFPFCKSKCPYCNFNSNPKWNNYIDEYIFSLKEEINLLPFDLFPKETKILSIYLGGGTPSLVSPYKLFEVIEKLNSRFTFNSDIEITIEANPDSLSKELCKELFEAGINRLCIGAQSFDDNILKWLGRRHDSKKTIKSFELAKSVGFNNINLDLILGIPKQTKKIWENDLKIISILLPTHISTYILTIEEGAYYYPLFQNKKFTYPNDELVSDMYYYANDFLSKMGYDHYEISNFAKNGFKSIHNLNYWKTGNYLGLGAGATSFLKLKDYNWGVRFKNFDNIKDYMNFIQRNIPFREKILEGEQLTYKDAILEYIFLNFRTKEGINLDKFKERFNFNFEDKYKSILEALIKEDFLIYNQKNISFTLKGFILSNEIILKFMDNLPD